MFRELRAGIGENAAIVDIDPEILALPEGGEILRGADCINFWAGRSRSLVNPESRLPLGSGGGAPPIEALAGFDVFRAFKWQEMVKIRPETTPIFLMPSPKLTVP